MRCFFKLLIEWASVTALTQACEKQYRKDEGEDLRRVFPQRASSRENRAGRWGADHERERHEGTRCERRGPEGLGQRERSARAFARAPYACVVVPGETGRIEVKLERVGERTVRHEYAYDPAGRLATVYRDGLHTEATPTTTRAAAARTAAFSA